MPLATYKDLCIDANDPGRLGRFWAAVLRLEFHALDDGDAKLTGPTPAHTVWINRVPEPKTVKHRVHLDVNAASVAEVERLGATVLDGHSHRWTVMADPEGGEFCVFVRDGGISRRLYELGVDTADSPEAAHRIAAWWAHVLDARLVDHDSGFSYVEDITGAPFEALVFAPVPEPKQVKNRIHIDVTTADLGGLHAAGATVLRAQDDEIRWHVMADPDGNEFCAFVTG
ncbi:MAG TPA: VOC family protein [Egibacteraceae bacterium]|nr:VOC family protein [Egibacteraceae bacterium]